MFKKEAEEYFETVCLHSYADTEEQLKEDVVPAFQKGAEFGYNKANKEIKLLKETHRQSIDILVEQIEELHKANEWHYVKDGDLPPLRKEVLWRVDEQLWLGELLETRIDFGEWELDSVLFNDYEIAWKEIVLPKGDKRK